MVLKVRLYASTRQRPATPPDGSSLEELMNDAIASIPLRKLVDVQATGATPYGSNFLFTGCILYQE